MKKITQFSVNFPVTVSMIVLGILLLGMISLQKLNIDLFPELNSPQIFVELKAGEISPEEIEQRFVQNMESVAIRQKNVINVSSVCMTGSARLTVEYTWGTDMNEAFLDLQKSLAMFGSNTEIETLNITQHDPNSSPVMIIAMYHSGTTDMDEMRKIGEGYIRNEMIRLEGIADVTLAGIEEKQLVVETDQYKLKAYGISVEQIVQRIESMNATVSGGTIIEKGLKYMIKGSGIILSPQDLENIVVGYKQSTTAPVTLASTSETNKVPIFLKDVAIVKFENKKPDSIVRINGERCVGLSVYRETDFNTVKATENLQESLTTIEKALPGYNFTVVQNQGIFIQNAIDEVKDSALIGSIIAILVLFFFLRSIGTTMIVGIAIPISVVATFNLMYFNGLTMNIMTLGGLALGAGMLVDNAIVVMENIFRNLENGMNLKDAAIKGTAQVGGAIVASTVTTIVVFLPIVYLSGASSAMFKDQAWTVSFSLLASLFVAILVIPMLFHQFFKNKELSQFRSVRIAWYGKMLGSLLDKRRWIVASTVVLLAVTAFIYPHIGSEYLPKSDATEFNVEIVLKEGSFLSKTEGTVKSIENMLTTMLDGQIESIYSQIGTNNSNNNGIGFGQGENTALIKVKLNDNSQRNIEMIMARIQDTMSEMPEMEIKVEKEESSLVSSIGSDDPPVTVEIKGKDLDQLEFLSSEIKNSLSSVPELINLETNIENGAPEIEVTIDRYKASVYGLNTNNILTQLKGQLMGKAAGNFEDKGDTKDIVVKVPEVSVAELNSILLKGEKIDVPLYEVAELTSAQAPKKLFRNNQNRIAKVTANIQGDIAFDKVVHKVKSSLSNVTVPPGYQVEVIGEEAKRLESISSLGFALILSIVLVYMVMASQFESLVHPFTILLTIPLAGVGAVWAFYLLGLSLNMMAYIGIIMLAGIAVNNSIILVDAINQLKSQGYQLREAIIEAGENRVRPIIMTSLTTILAMLPLSMGFGESASLRSPLAIAVIAGLITSTLLSLVVIPCVYFMIDSLRARSNSTALKVQQ